MAPVSEIDHSLAAAKRYYNTIYSYIYIRISIYLGLSENGVYPCISKEHGDKSSHFQTNQI
jgi:hypothetical protein